MAIHKSPAESSATGPAIQKVPEHPATVATVGDVDDGRAGNVTADQAVPSNISATAEPGLTQPAATHRSIDAHDSDCQEVPGGAPTADCPVHFEPLYRQNGDDAPLAASASMQNVELRHDMPDDVKANRPNGKLGAATR
jgi:hypothetical protein